MSAGNTWQPPADSIALDADAAHVWRLPLVQSPATVSRLAGLLAPDELARARRFATPALRDHFVVARAALRQILARYLGVDPAAIQFHYGAYGKPAIALPQADVHFNLAHSGDLALCAVTPGHDLGVDVERLRPVPDDAIIRRFFSSREQAAYLEVPASERSLAFFMGWTRKEAYIKALGDGLAKPLGSFAVTLTPGLPARLAHDDADAAAADRWQIVALPCDPGYVAALAMPAPIRQLSCWQWHPASRVIKPLPAGTVKKGARRLD